jgi:glycosyltransferase involved in cell wall biosynthesis
MPRRQNNKKDKVRPIKVDQIIEAKYNTENNDITLELPDITTEDLPFVSVVTITKNRRSMFAIPLFNWSRIVYPEDRLEWIILDDGEDDLSDIIPFGDKRINYVRCEKMGIGEKRNHSVDLAKHDYIVHMDDDDFYFPHSLLAKIRVLLHYNKKCVYSHNLGVYDILSKTSAIMERYTDVPELTMAYTKEFWESRKFGNAPYESYNMVRKREKDIVKIPFWFNAIACTHDTNYTQRLKSISISSGTPRPAPPVESLFDPEFKTVFGRVSARILSSRAQDP